MAEDDNSTTSFDASVKKCDREDDLSVNCSFVTEVIQKDIDVVCHDVLRVYLENGAVKYDVPDGKHCKPR